MNIRARAKKLSLILSLCFLMFSCTKTPTTIIDIPDHATDIYVHEYRPLVSSYRPEAHYHTNTKEDIDLLLNHLKKQQTYSEEITSEMLVSDFHAFDVQIIIHSTECPYNQCFLVARFLDNGTILLVSPDPMDQATYPAAIIEKQNARDVISRFKKSTP
ncbi:MAG TPA: hypothetical protein DEA51_03975 [Erysipelotrichaceae bacterium]|nr:hypothetical protein [Erysipelotrichaceae bacterium]